MPHLLSHEHELALYNAEATRAIERAAAAALPEHALMQRAGLATAHLALALAPHARRVWIACGPGNNGGDGLETAANLQQWGLAPWVTWLGSEAKAPRDARLAMQRARAAHVKFSDTPPTNLDALDLCIDALLGVGANRAPTGRMVQWLALLHASHAPLLAIDVPSGLDVDTGVLYATSPSEPGSSANHPPTAPRHTLSLLTLKPGLFTAQGRDACGTLWFDGLGSSPAPSAPTAWLTARPRVPPRPEASHKGWFGDVAVVGGEDDRACGTAMMGAALIAATAALHAGAGRVYVALLGTGDMHVSERQPELMFRKPNTLALEKLTVVCGCGGGTAVQTILPDILERAAKLVLDADALNAIAADEALQGKLVERARRGQPTVLTPHPLEAARLLAVSSAEVQADRLRAAQTLADKFTCTAVLKGSGTVIAAPDRVPRINSSGNARLATPGSGDALAGLMGARLAIAEDAFAAACRAVFEHGAVASCWLSPATLTASALARSLTP